MKLKSSGHGYPSGKDYLKMLGLIITSPLWIPPVAVFKGAKKVFKKIKKKVKK